MGRRSIQMKKLGADSSETVVVNQIDLGAMGWQDLRGLAKENGVTVYHRRRSEIEHDLRGVLAGG